MQPRRLKVGAAPSVASVDCKRLRISWCRCKRVLKNFYLSYRDDLLLACRSSRASIAAAAGVKTFFLLHVQQMVLRHRQMLAAAKRSFAKVLLVINCALVFLSFFLRRSLFQFRQPVCCNCVLGENLFFIAAWLNAFLECFASPVIYTLLTPLSCVAFCKYFMRLCCYDVRGIETCVNAHILLFLLRTVDFVQCFLSLR